MIKIIEKGTIREEIRKGTCKVCGCKFSYTLNDLKPPTIWQTRDVYGYLDCPQCHKPIAILSEDIFHSSDDDE